MKISSITLQNFRSYRDTQQIEFGTGEKYITIIEGQMGHGKTNLLNAFYWCLFDQYWDSDKNKLITKPDPVESDLFNKGAFEEFSEKGEVELRVEVKFLDDDQNTYTVKRTQKARFSNGKWNYDSNSKIHLEKVDAETGEFSDFPEEEAEGEIQKFFPRSLSQYFLFRGENRTHLVKLQGKTEFQDALNELSKIEVFKRAEKDLNKAYKDFNKELANNAEGEVKENMDAASKKQEDAQKAIEEYEEQISNLETIEDQKRDENNLYKDRIKQNYEALKFQRDIDAEEKNIKDLKEQKDQLLEKKRFNLAKYWGGLIAKDVVQDVQEKYNQGVQTGKYPPDIKQSLVKKILYQDKQCICGNPVKENSKEYKRIESLLQKEDFDGLTHEIEGLNHSAQRIKRYLENVPGEIKEYDSNETELDQEIKRKQGIVRGYKSKVGELDESLQELQQKQDEANNELQKTIEKKKELQGNIKNKKKEVSDAQKEFEQWKNKLNRAKLPKEKTELARKALEEAKALKNQFEETIFNDLEQYTQENWEKLVYDKLIYDKVELNREEMFFDVLDTNGNYSRKSMNTGHSILLVLSFISALVRIAKEIWKEEFPLVLDAPLSEVGESALPVALNGFGDIFNQGIVILKDGTVTEHMEKELDGVLCKRYWIEFDKNRQHSQLKSLN